MQSFNPLTDKIKRSKTLRETTLSGKKMSGESDEIFPRRIFPPIFYYPTKTFTRFFNPRPKLFPDFFPRPKLLPDFFILTEKGFLS